MKDSISAIILAAGTSSRMGRPKQLLDWGGRPLLSHVIHKGLYHPFSEVITVIGHEADKIKRTIHIRDSRFKWVENKQYRSGQGSSLRAGVQHISTDSQGVMVFLGDLPFISQYTTSFVFHEGARLLKCSLEPFAIKPVYQKTGGHPVFFGHLRGAALEVLDGDPGGRALLNMIKVKRELFVQDSGIVKDIDTRDDYRQALKQGDFDGDG